MIRCVVALCAIVLPFVMLFGAGCGPDASGGAHGLLDDESATADGEPTVTFDPGDAPGSEPGPPDSGPADPVEDTSPGAEPDPPREPEQPEEPNQPDAPEPPDTEPPEEEPPEEEPPEEEPIAPDPTEGINDQWIGGACQSIDDCPYEDATCEPEADGYPAGMCSQPCDKYCPDADGMVTTFCIEPGLCAMRCDFGLSPTGCRPGYSCVPLARYNDPNTVVPTCVPADGPNAIPNGGLTECQQALSAQGIGFSPAANPGASPADYPWLKCDVEDPIKVVPTMYGVTFRYSKLSNAPQPIFASCPLALAMAASAKLLAEQGVTDVLHWGVYNCRIIGGTNPPKLSEHGRANAIDIRGLVTADGTLVTVVDDWEKDTSFPATDAGAFLKWWAATLYNEWVFNIILTPDYNQAHHDHFHMDLTPGSHFMK